MMIPLPIKKIQVDYLPVSIYADNLAMGRASALDAREQIVKAISERGESSIILATGNSQLTFLHTLKELNGIDWTKVRIFHMDEYLGLASTHPASFPLFLKEHFIQHINPSAFYPVPNSPDNIERACRDYEQLLRDYPADLVAMGWGENGHIAFNDPPDALFNDQQWVKVVELAEVSRRQQVGEGHFGSLSDVPTHAITLTIPALLAPKRILCIVPEARKAEAVRSCLNEPVSEEHPGSILRTLKHASLYLDLESSANL